MFKKLLQSVILLSSVSLIGMEKEKDFFIQITGIENLEKNMVSITRFATDTFLINHEITRHYLQATPDNLKIEFMQLFEDHISDMVREINKQKGLFFTVTDKDGAIIGISMGRPYGTPTLSDEFMGKAHASQSEFMKVLGGWWQLMEKYQANPEDHPGIGLVYHQALTAIHPHYVGKNIGTDLSEYVMQEIRKRGYSVLARETSSLPANKVAQKLAKKIDVETIDEVTNEKTGIKLVLRVQSFKEDKETVKPIIAWFKNKKENRHNN
jgi:hypothetical protein